jgi:HAD superfamily hydrolase (TIGR01509 family)
VIRAVFFDFFNTLFYFDEAEGWERLQEDVYGSIHRFLEGVDFAAFKEEYELIYFEQVRKREIDLMEPYLTERFVTLYERLGRHPSDAAVIAGVEAYESSVTAQITPAPGVAEVLSQLSKRYWLGIVSNCRTAESVTTPLEQHGLIRYISAVVASSDVGFVKPHQTIFQKALQAAHVDAAEACFVGDHFRIDIEGAKGAGFTTIYVKQTAQPSQMENLEVSPEREREFANYTVSGLRGVLEILK